MRSVFRSSVRFHRSFQSSSCTLRKAFSTTGSEDGNPNNKNFSGEFTDDFANAATVQNSSSFDTGVEAQSHVAVNTAMNNADIVGTAISSEAATAASKLGDFSTISSKPYGLFMQALEDIHVGLGVPYWEAIAISALAIRFAVLPLALNSIRTGGRMLRMQPDLAELNKRYVGEGGKVPKERAQEYAKEYGEMAAKHDVNPVRAFLLPLFQLPVSICAFMGIRAMGDYFPDYANGGGLWFPDLVAADPTYILPVLNSLTFLCVVELGRFNQVAPTTVAQAQQQGIMRNVMRGLGVGMLVVTQSMPAGLLCFWVTSNTWNMLQTAVVSTPAVKKMLH